MREGAFVLLLLVGCGGSVSDPKSVEVAIPEAGPDVVSVDVGAGSSSGVEAGSSSGSGSSSGGAMDAGAEAAPGPPPLCCAVYWDTGVEMNTLMCNPPSDPCLLDTQCPSGQVGGSCTYHFMETCGAGNGPEYTGQIIDCPVCGTGVYNLGMYSGCGNDTATISGVYEDGGAPISSTGFCVCPAGTKCHDLMSGGFGVGQYQCK